MYKEVEEQELARLCSERNRMAEDELYRRYAARVYTLCRRYAGDEEEAKDLMQEALIQALDKIQTFKYFGKGSLQAWISRIAINKAISQVRRRRWQMVSLDFLQAQDRLPVFSSIQRYAIALVAPGRIFIMDVSTFCRRKSSRIMRPSASSPTVPANAAESPSAAAAAVEFAAGPPPRMACDSILTFVSIGMNGNTARWSFEQKPMPM